MARERGLGLTTLARVVAHIRGLDAVARQQLVVESVAHGLALLEREHALEHDEARVFLEACPERLEVVELLASAEIEQDRQQLHAGLQVVGIDDVGIGHQLVERGGLGQHHAVAVDDVGAHHLLRSGFAARLDLVDLRAQLIGCHHLPVAEAHAGSRADDGEDEQDDHHAQAAVGTAEGWHLRAPAGRSVGLAA